MGGNTLVHMHEVILEAKLKLCERNGYVIPGTS